MATTNTWEEVVEKIGGVANRGAFSKTFSPTTSVQSASGAAGYYSSVSTTCNAVSLSGNAGTGQVLTGYTFYNNSLTKQTGTIANRGTLNWTPTGSTTYSVSAGYYSGGTLNSGTAYMNGYNAGVSAGKNTYGIKTATGSSTIPSQSSTVLTFNFTVYAFFAKVGTDLKGTMASSMSGIWIMQNGVYNYNWSGSSKTSVKISSTTVTITSNSAGFNNKPFNYVVYGV